MRHTQRQVAGGLVLAISASACTTSIAERFDRVNEGMVLTDGVRIEGNRFELTANERFRAPFSQMANCLLRPSAEGTDDAVWSGAEAVKLHHPRRAEPYYGLLSLCGAPDIATGPGARRFLIEVPDEMLDDARGGRVGVTWENHQSDVTKLGTKAWILWLSDLPIPPARAPQRTPATALTTGSWAPVDAAGAQSDSDSGSGSGVGTAILTLLGIAAGVTLVSLAVSE